MQDKRVCCAKMRLRVRQRYFSCFEHGTLKGTTPTARHLERVKRGTCCLDLYQCRALVSIDKDLHIYYNLVKNSYIRVIILFYT